MPFSFEIDQQVVRRRNLQGRRDLLPRLVQAFLGHKRAEQGDAQRGGFRVGCHGGQRLFQLPFRAFRRAKTQREHRLEKNRVRHYLFQPVAIFPRRFEILTGGFYEAAKRKYVHVGGVLP